MVLPESNEHNLRWKELVDTMSDVSDDGETSSIADSPTRSETSSSSHLTSSTTVTHVSSNKPAKKESKAVHHQTVKQEPKSIANNDLTTSGNYTHPF